MKPIFITILALCCLLPVEAQNPAGRDSLLSREMTLEREYTPIILDAVKIGQLPELREPQAPRTQVEFSNYAVPFNVPLRLSLLSPQAYLTHLNYSKNKGFLTAGVSSLIDIDGDFGYQILNTNKDRLNIFFSHRSSSSDVSYLQEQVYEDESRKFKINDNWGGLNYLHNFGDIQFIADAKYTYSAFNYYGLYLPLYGGDINPSPPNLQKDTNQVNNLFKAQFGVFSEKDYELNYKINAGYASFRQKYGNTPDQSGSTENRLLIDADVNKMISSAVGLGVTGAVNTYSYSAAYRLLNDTLKNYWAYALNPYLYVEEANLNLVLGVKMDVEVGGREKIIISPAIRFNYYPSNQLMFYIHAGGGRKDNSQYNLFYENRYIDPLFRVWDSRSPVDATTGIKFTPLSTLSIGIFGGYKITKDEHFFHPAYGIKNRMDPTPSLAGNWIIPIYEDASTIKLGAELNYAYQNAFEFNLKGTYYKWSIDSKQEQGLLQGAWNKPDFEMNMNAAYRFPAGLPLRLDLSYYGAFGRKAIDPLRNDRMNMGNINDLSVRGTYSFTPNFSVYCSLRNALISKYDFWWGYPAQDLNIMGGLSILF